MSDGNVVVVFGRRRSARPTLAAKSHRYALIAAILLANAAAEPVSFTRDVAPIFQQNCVGCHREGKAKGKYRMDSYTHVAKALVAGNLDDSEIFYRITIDDGDERMPADADPLADAEIAIIRKWIEEGAEYDSDDPGATLASILPAAPHRAAPDTYRRAIPVMAMVFSQDGAELFASGYHEILVWDPADGRLIRRIAPNAERTYGLALSPDGRFLAAATGAPGQSGELRIFDSESGEVVATPARTDDIVLCVAFDPEGKRLALGAADGRLRIFDTASWKQTVIASVHSDWINALTWNEDGTRLATASRDKTAKVFEIGEKAKRLITFSGHTEAVRGVAFHPGGEEVLSSGDHGLLLRWKISDGKKSADLANFGGQSLRLVGTEAGYFATAPDGHAVQLAKADQRHLRQFRIEPASILSACAPHGTRLALGTFDGRIVSFELENAEQTGSFIAAP